MSCDGNCAECNDERTKSLKKHMEKSLEDVIFELKADYEARLTENGVSFSQGLNSINTGEIPDTKENRARVALGWIGMALAMEHPRESEKGFGPL